MFKDLDVYKVILLASILLVPGAWGYAYHLDSTYQEAEQSKVTALRENGLVYKIGELSEQLENVKRNAERGVDQEPKLFFKNQIQNTDRSGRIKSTSFTVETKEPAVTSRSRSRDVTVSIDFVEKDFALSRDYLHALTFNCESQGVQIWKLREFSMENAALKSFNPAKDRPPLTVPDDWIVRKLEFARREPGSK